MIRAALQDSGAVGFTYGNTSDASVAAAEAVLGTGRITPAALAEAFPGAQIGHMRGVGIPMIVFGDGMQAHETERQRAAIRRDESSMYSSELIKETVRRVRNVLADIEYEDWDFRCGDRGGMVYIVATFGAPCNVAGGADLQQLTRRWLIRPEASEAEIAQTTLKCVLTALEHEAREKFAYRGRAIFGPHNELAVLWDCAEEVV